jgi:hypothetical protein
MKKEVVKITKIKIKGNLIFANPGNNEAEIETYFTEQDIRKVIDKFTRGNCYLIKGLTPKIMKLFTGG